MKELEVSVAGKGEISQSGEEDTDPHGRASDWEWSYHDGTAHYSCSGLDGEVH